jgi:hypothetical protein
VNYIGAVQSIVTSGASNDSGLFETNLHDERFLPFEGAGAESTWKLELPRDYRAFDYDTISDVILHIRYTARQGVDPNGVKKALGDLLQQASQSNLALLFSLRHDFPTEWSAFVNGTANFTATIRKDYFPYVAQGKTITITGLELYLYDGKDVSKHHEIGGQAAWDAATADLDNKQAFTVTAGTDQTGPNTASAQIFLIVRYALVT